MYNYDIKKAWRQPGENPRKDFIMCKNYNTEEKSCQEDNYIKKRDKIFKKLLIKRNININTVNWLKDEQDINRALRIEECGTYIGFYKEENIPKIVKANFCRERLCAVCAWRRQAKFISQMKPILNSLINDGYEFLFCTLTIKNCKYDELEKGLNTILEAFSKLRKRRKIKRNWTGMCRSVELTYNHKTNTYHPHIHILIAVENDYFKNKDKYITQEELSCIWKECCNIDYRPICDIRKVNDTDKGVVETLKYSLKPSNYEESLKAFHYILSGRRLISFTGIFSQRRKELKLLDFENNLLDEIEIKNKVNKTYDVYKIDCTGGMYKFYRTFKLEGE